MQRTRDLWPGLTVIFCRKVQWDSEAGCECVFVCVKLKTGYWWSNAAETVHRVHEERFCTDTAEWNCLRSGNHALLYFLTEMNLTSKKRPKSFCLLLEKHERSASSSRTASRRTRLCFSLKHEYGVKRHAVGTSVNIVRLTRETQKARPRLWCYETTVELLYIDKCWPH